LSKKAIETIDRRRICAWVRRHDENER
jgi:hypothetical protein